MARLLIFPIAAAALVATSVPTVEGIGFYSPVRLPTQDDVARLDSTMANVTAYKPTLTTRVCYTKIADVVDYFYINRYSFYRVKACLVPTVLAPKCSAEQLAACTPSFYTINVDGFNHTEITRLDNEDTDQNETRIGNSTDAPTTSTPTSVVPTPVPTTKESTSNSSATNNTEAGAVTAPASAVPASTPKQSGAVSVSAGIISVVATLAAVSVSL